MYSVFYTKEAKTVIDRVVLKKKRQIKDAIERIADNPAIGKRLTHELKGLFSYRSGAYRIIYRVDHEEITIMILTIGHRKNIYKKVPGRSC